MTTNPNVPFALPGGAGAVEVTLSAEQASVQTVRTAVEVVTIARRIVTETVQVPVQVRHEELVVTRRPVGRTSPPDLPEPASGGLNSLIPEPRRELVIVLRHEVPLVSLGIEATERVSVNVDTVTGQQTVNTELRREHAEVTTSDLPNRGTGTGPT